MAGMSKRFAARTYEAAAPVVDAKLAPETPVPSGGPGGKKKRPTGSVLPLVFLALILIVLGVLLLRAIPSSFAERLGSLLDGGRPSATPTVVPVARNPDPTIVTVASACPAGCAPVAVGATPSATDPAVTIILYTINQEPVTADTVRLGYQGTYPDGFYQPIAVGGASCAGPSIHVVRPGDTVYGLARCFGVDPYAIVAANGLGNPDYLQVGQVLAIPCAPARWFGAP